MMKVTVLSVEQAEAEMKYAKELFGRSQSGKFRIPSAAAAERYARALRLLQQARERELDKAGDLN